MNEPLRRALLRARLRKDDVAARLGVDPKTVRRWLNGRVPYTSNRLALAERIDRRLMRWALRKYKRLKGRKPRARAWLRGVRQRQPGLFAHWSLCYTL